MKDLTKKAIFVILILLIIAPGIALAQDGVVLLEDSLPIKGIEGTVEQGQLGEYLNGLFLLGIGVASGLAVLYITIGGVQYMVGASAGNKERGREKIMGAVGGLVLALASFLILNTINPDLLEFKIDQAIQSIVKEVQEGQDEVREEREIEDFIEEEFIDKQTWQSDANLRLILAQVTNRRVTINNRNCAYVGDFGCTSLAGILSGRFYQGVINIMDTSKCGFTINGGTEYWLHGNRSTDLTDNKTKHKPNNAVIDIRDDGCINDYIMGGTIDNPQFGTPVLECFEKVVKNGVTYQWEAGTCSGSTGNHWHVTL